MISLTVIFLFIGIPIYVYTFIVCSCICHSFGFVFSPEYSVHHHHVLRAVGLRSGRSDCSLTYLHLHWTSQSRVFSRYVLIISIELHLIISVWHHLIISPDPVMSSSSLLNYHGLNTSPYYKWVSLSWSLALFPIMASVYHSWPLHPSQSWPQNLSQLYPLHIAYSWPHHISLSLTLKIIVWDIFFNKKMKIIFNDSSLSMFENFL